MQGCPYSLGTRDDVGMKRWEDLEGKEKEGMKEERREGHGE